MTKQEHGHTATPWRVFHKNEIIAIMRASKSNHHNEIVHWAGFDESHFPEQALANAKLIVNAVNERDSLLAEIARLKRELERISAVELGPHKMIEAHWPARLMQMIARAALTAASGRV